MQDLVLIGGGHSHALALLRFGRNPVLGVRLTLISDSQQSPYSGMLPGHIAGFYSREECHIDLIKLTKFAGAQLIIDRAVGLDLEEKQVICSSGRKVNYDILSINIGSTPATISVPGATEYAIKAKPVSVLLENWHNFCKELKLGVESSTIGIVGGGAGGVELALSMLAGLNTILQSDNLRKIEIHLFQRHQELLPNYHPRARQLAANILQKKGIQLHLGESVSQIQALPEIHQYSIICESGLNLQCTKIFWVTQASAPQWLKSAGLATDDKGFILVNKTLQSVSHPSIFAAGDIATIVKYQLPKAGVFAVREGKPLFENLRQYLSGKSLTPYRPQQQYLSLIGTGDGKAFATRGAFTLPPNRLLWWWKDWIDKQFMSQFENLTPTKHRELGMGNE